MSAAATSACPDLADRNGQRGSEIGGVTASSQPTLQPAATASTVHSNASATATASIAASTFHPVPPSFVTAPPQIDPALPRGPHGESIPTGHRSNDTQQTCVGCVADRIIHSTRCEAAASRDWCRRYCDYRCGNTAREAMAHLSEDRQRLASIERVLGVGDSAWDIKSLETLQNVRDQSSLASATFTVMGLLVARVDALERERVKNEQEKLATACWQADRDGRLQDITEMLSATREELKQTRDKVEQLERRGQELQSRMEGSFVPQQEQRAGQVNPTPPSSANSEMRRGGTQHNEASQSWAQGPRDGEIASNGETAAAVSGADESGSAKRKRDDDDASETDQSGSSKKVAKDAASSPDCNFTITPFGRSPTSVTPRSAGRASAKVDGTAPRRSTINLASTSTSSSTLLTVDEAASQLSRLSEQLRTPSSFLRHTQVSGETSPQGHGQQDTLGRAASVPADRPWCRVNTATSGPGKAATAPVTLSDAPASSSSPTSVAIAESAIRAARKQLEVGQTGEFQQEQGEGQPSSDRGYHVSIKGTSEGNGETCRAEAAKEASY
ncbi:hypothetical protein BDZ90DRAFT_269669 [Jaminaea rosea]|uniref:Uncharacterized protein n=1 Tax=Jaminaea rosea TaxID=1569628 RepID=A0A316UXK4_9BASI|nr:hypothetical protein BDZ90DRAFT_269669 [Jaminaea rosea]PWN29724.1 hypothetical protein BDZ90DRAFT_269669 [Jaminaea rosea]